MSVVTVETHGDVAVLSMNYPPVNALSHALRSGLADGLQKVAKDNAVKAVVLHCQGRTFVAGADITEFGKPPQSPGLSDVIAMLEASPKPTIAAIHGTALGGGLELALGCHYRVASPDAKWGLPEVKLGLLPGAGGTQRLPRAIGPIEALKVIVSGDHKPAKLGHDLGLIAEIIPGRPESRRHRVREQGRRARRQASEPAPGHREAHRRQGQVRGSGGRTC